MLELGDILRRLRQHRQTALLVTIITLFAIRPAIGDDRFAEVVFSIAILAMSLVALLTIQVDEMLGERETLLAQKKWRSRAGWALVAPALADRLLMIVGPNQGLSHFGSISWLVFLVFVTGSQLRSLLRQKEVTGETISTSISVYLLMGVCWGLLYIVVFQRHPDSFNLGSTAAVDERNYFPVFIYFSLTTLSTLGLGDITPLTLQARYAAVAEGIAGQFYLAILVARLVGMQMSRTTSEPGSGS